MIERVPLQPQSDPTLPAPIVSVLLNERRRENLFIADALKRRAAETLASALAHHARWLLVGVVTGSLFVVPLVLFLTGHIAQGSGTALQVGTPGLGRGERPPGLISAPRLLERPAAADHFIATVTDPLDSQLERARALLTARRVDEARTTLAGLDLATTPKAAFVIAETFDPNILAALNITDVAADPDRARHLYGAALAGGVAAAAQRLEALQ